jgi:hypothetical protein
MPTRRRGTLLTLLVSLCLLEAARADLLVATNSLWRLRKGTNEVSNPTILWRNTAFDDSDWQIAPAPFHYGTNSIGGDDEVRTGTVLGDMRGRYTSIFLRNTFVITNVAEIQSLRLLTWYDDGFVAWINGVEVARALVSGQPTNNSTATSSHEALPPVAFVAGNVPQNYLVIGTNVLAVQAFNQSLSGSTDFRFETTVDLAKAETVPPVIAGVSPAPGTVANLTRITVTFSEPVNGVSADDLLINNLPAISVTGSDAVYTFEFLPPAYGPVTVTWDPGHSITDRAVPPNPFNATAPDASWLYDLRDTTEPTVAVLKPVPNAPVRTLTQIEVHFTEPVTNVDAADLLINGQRANGLTGSAAGPYVFEFPGPPTGMVQVAWATGHGIMDLASPPNSFSGGSWSYTLDPNAPLADVHINEFLAGNVLTNSPLDLDEDGELQDWIELYNAGSNSVRLLGWSLTDTRNQPDLWLFPDITIGAGQYLIVYASAKDRRPVTGGKLHSNFKLNVFGEYLALFNSDAPQKLMSEFAPAFPEQRNDHSYGLESSNQWRYFATPTPGAANGKSAVTGIVPEPHANVSRGLFDQPFTLFVTCEQADATLRYTTNGSVPTELTGQIYTGPIQVTNTTVFRVAGFRTSMLPSRVSTHTYLFYDQVLRQPNNPPGYPAAWVTLAGASYPADYEMDPEIVTNSAYAPWLKPALNALPVVSIVMKIEDMFSQTTGIYANPEPSNAQRYLWERACSVEFIPTNNQSGFHVDCGIRIQGNASRTPAKTSKHPMRLMFRGDYGPGRLEYPIYSDSPVTSFDTVVLRGDFNSSWLHWDPNQRLHGTRMRDVWAKDTFRAMGQLGGHSRYVHLFVNGLYWGVYDFSERIDANFAASYLGGNAEDYDSMAAKPTEALDGDRSAYDTMVANVRTKDMRLLANYTAALQYLDLTNYVDYILLNFYAANQDWGFDSNWNAVRRRLPGALYKYCVWDAERYIENTGDNRVSNPDVPSGLHTNLINSSEYRLFFADRVQKHLFNAGALTTNQTIPRWINRANQLDTAIIAESARWGDNRRDVMMNLGGGSGPFYLYTRNDFWLPEINRMITSYFPQRAATFLGQLRNARLYPAVAVPSFSQHGGRVAAGYLLAISGSNPIYFTADGSDPRVYGTGAVSPSAQAYTAPFPLNADSIIKSRALSDTNWSALNEATFTVGSLGVPLRLTEIMYNPPGGDVYEYIELQNTGTLTLNLGNFTFTGIGFTFPLGYTLLPGQRIVLGSNLSTNAFQARYPGLQVAGWFDGRLDNNGETILLSDGVNPRRHVLSVTYDNHCQWPTAADRNGYSLEIVSPNGDPNDPSNWRADAPYGTPGQPNSAIPAPSVLINELMADNATAVNHNGTYPDWVELYNSVGATTNIAGWSLSDDDNPRKFVFPAGTVISAGAYLVVWCDSTTNITPGFHTGFALGRSGDGVFLYDAQTNRIDAVSFGSQVTDYSLGRLGDAWNLTTPTPGAGNVAAALAGGGDLSINEWLANAAPDGTDWVELFNPSGTAPVALQDFYLGTSNALFQIRSLTFIGPRGYLQLFADEQPGASHLDLKLPSAAGAIVLYDPTGAEVQRVTYGAQTEGLSYGRWPDGGSSLVAFPGSASPAASNYVADYTGPVLNEVLAANSSAALSTSGNYPDYVELFNPSGTAFNLGGLGLSDEADHGKFVFAPDTVIAPDGYLVVWCDGGRATTTNGALNSGFSLDRHSGGVYLFNTAGQVVDSVEYGFQVTDLPIGLSGGSWRLLSTATPGLPNAGAATLGSATNLRINEWMANPLQGNDWIELYNPGPLPVDMTGLIITDDPSFIGLYSPPVAPLSFIGGHDRVQWMADGARQAGRDHASFDLDQDGELIRVYAPNLDMVDSISFGAQSNGVSQGLLPDGGSSVVSFTTTPTPEQSNYLPVPGIVINEILAHTDAPLEDALELLNLSATEVNLGGWYLSDSQTDFRKYRIADGTTISPSGFKVFYESQFNGGTGSLTPFTFDSVSGDEVWLSEADATGNLTGYRTAARFGASANGVSFGRYRTSAGIDFVPMSQRTFGTDQPGSLAEFRTGGGRTNAGPLVGPIVINEIMYHPPDSRGLIFTNDNTLDEFLSLLNITANPVPLFDPAAPTNHWRIGGGIDFTFPPNIVLAPAASLLLVNFDPYTDTNTLAAFQGKFGVPATTPVFGPYAGKLANRGERIELLKPDPPQTSGPQSGLVPYVLVEAVSYSDAPPWPPAADGTGASLQRINASGYANEPTNWFAAVPKAGAGSLPDQDGDGIPDSWENAHGLRSGDANDAAEDPDHDGYTNLQEYIAGTDPQDAQSFLKFSQAATSMDGLMTFTFTAVAGKTYALQYCDSVASGVWLTLTNIPAQSVTQIISVNDAAPGEAHQRFYRIVTPQRL